MGQSGEIHLEANGAIRTIAPGNFADAIFSSDGSRLFAVSGNTVSVIDVATGTVLNQYIAGVTGGGIDISPDGNRLVVVERANSGTGNSTFYEINLTTGVITSHSVAGTSGPFFDVSFLADGTLLLSQQDLGFGGSPLRMFNFTSNQFSVVATPGNMGSATLTASADSSHVFIQSGLASFVYVSGVGFVAQQIPPPYDPYAGAALPTHVTGVLAISLDGNLYVQGETLNVYDSSLNLLASLTTSYPYLSAAQGMAFSANGQQLYVASGDSIIAFDTSTWEVLGSYGAGGTVPVANNPTFASYIGYGDIVQASPDGHYLSVITGSGLQLIDLTTVAFESTPGADTITGDGTIYGLGGNDDLSGVGTFTTMYGGTGDDSYHITGYSDLAYEQPNEGHDTVHSVISYSLGANFEDLVLDGSDNIGGFGNQGDNSILGNTGNNELGGGAGSDHIEGGDGDDKLDGGAGQDFLDGGAGIDTANYLSALQGVTVDLSKSGPQNTLGDGVDTLVNIENLFGSWQDDQLTGNTGANRLEGFVGNDVLSGGLGADYLVGGDGVDVFRDTKAGLNGDTIEDFTTADKIIITDANINTFTFNLSGNVLNYTGGSITLGAVPTGPIYAFEAAGGGVQLQIGPLTGTMDQIARQLTNGYWNGDQHRWNVAPGGTITVSISTLTFTERTLARAALAEWTDITGIHFREVPSGGQIIFNHNEEPGGPVAYTDSDWSNGIITSASIHISSSWVNLYGSTLGTYSFQTYIHEIGHALGLGHSGDYNETANYPTDIIFYNDSWSTSVMSYFDQDEAWYQVGDFSRAFAVTPMQADIIAMQTLYGLSTTTRLNDTVYGYNSNADGIYNANSYPNVAYTIFDNGGNDTLDFSGWAGSQVINLNPEAFSSVVGGEGNVAIARGVVIENAIGGGSNDTITGNAAANRLTGNLGADILTGGSGNDTFQDSKAGLNGDTITDFGVGDRIVITDAALAGFNFNFVGNTLTYTGGSLTLTGLFTGTIVATAAAGGGVQLAIEAPSSIATVSHSGDFNGDGRDDLFWRHDDGRMSNWLGLANGGFSDNAANAYTDVPVSWQVAGFGDFNGDSRDDVLWRNSDGRMTDWLGQSNGGFFDNAANSSTFVPTSWQVVGVGDFNGDTRDDILWRNDDGRITNWLGLADGGFFDNAGNSSTSVPTSWQVAGVGDFNGDGRDDILWRNDDGRITNWLGLANGGYQDNAANALTSVPTSWHVVGVGDFNGDNRDDILWRNDDGRITNWLGLANGGYQDNAGSSSTFVPLGWHVASIGDFNGDNRDDILWRNDDGRITDWLGLANGGYFDNASNSMTGVPTQWHVEVSNLF